MSYVFHRVNGTKESRCPPGDARLRRHTLMLMCTTTGNLREHFVKRPRQTGQTSMYDHYGPWRGHDSAPLMGPAPRPKGSQINPSGSPKFKWVFVGFCTYAFRTPFFSHDAQILHIPRCGVSRCVHIAAQTWTWKMLAQICQQCTMSPIMSTCQWKGGRKGDAEEAKCSRGWGRESALGVRVQYGCRV